MTLLKRNSSFKVDVLKLVSGTAISQVINVGISPVLARLFSPESFGTLTLFTSIVSIITVISCFRYELSIMLPDNDKEASNLLGISIVFAIVTTLITTILFLIGGNFIINILKAPDLLLYIGYIPLMVLFSSIFLALNYWNSRTKHFTRLSVAKVSSSFLTAVVQIVYGVAGFVSSGILIGASILGQGVTTFILFGQILHNDQKLFKESIRYREMLAGLKRYIRFPLYGTWSALINTISWQLPPFLLSYYFSSIVVGYYSFGLRILQLPMSLIGTSIGQVFFQRAAEYKAKDSTALKIFVESTLNKMVVISIFPILLLSILGQDIYILIFGQNWSEAGLYSQILSIWAFFWFISTPLSNLTSVMEEQKFAAYWSGILLLTRLASMFIGGYYHSVYLALILYSATGVLMYGSLLIIQTGWVGVRWQSILTIIGKNFLISLPFLVIIIAFKIFISNKYILLTTGITSICIYYYYQIKTIPSLMELEKTI